MGSRVNTVKIARTDAQLEREWADGGPLGLDVVEYEGRVVFHTTQPEARIGDSLEVGDRVVIITMSDDGALGKGSTYVGEIEDIESTIAWVVGR